MLSLSKIGVPPVTLKKWRSTLQKLKACSSHWAGVSLLKMQALWLFFFSHYARQVSGVSIFLLGGVSVSGGRGGGERGLLFFVPVWEEARRVFSFQTSMGGRGKGSFFFLALLFPFFGGWGRYGLYSFTFLVTGWANNRRERPFSLLFFCFCRAVTQWRGRPHVPQNTLKTPIWYYGFFFQIKIIFQIWPLEAIYMCRLLQLQKLKITKKEMPKWPKCH